MKKIFTLVASALCAMNMMAKDYTGSMLVSVNGVDSPILENKSITVEKQANGKYSLSVKDFTFGTMKVGTINLTDIEPNENSSDQLTALEYEGPITITKNEDGSGMLAGQQMKMQLGLMLNDKLMTTIMNIDAGMLGEVGVEFKSYGSQIPNSDMENFHTAKATVEKEDGPVEVTTQEPNHWHSFTTATGMLANVVHLNKQIDESTDVRPDSEGKKSAKVTSAITIFGIAANGTMTTGQLQAAGFTADSPANCSFLDMSNEALDDNGDPFYTTIAARPDAIKAWVKYIPGGEKADYEIKKTSDDGMDIIATGEYSLNASVKAVITDGTRYQDPEDPTAEYKNVVGMAKQEIESKNGEWQEITVPFDYATYAANNAETKAILVNFGTNAYPGCASMNAEKPDELYVDDVELVYNCDITSLKYKGEEVKLTATDDYDGEGTVNDKGTSSLDDFAVETNGAGAIVTKKWEYDADWDQWELHIYVVSADLADEREYSITNLANKGFVTGIKNLESITLPAGVQAIYNVAGQQVTNMQKGQVYVVKYTNGKTQKMIKK